MKSLLYRIKYFRRYRTLKKNSSQAIASAFREIASLKEELKFQKDHYEKALLVERTRVESLHSAWADRFLQLQKLGSLGVTSQLIAEKSAHLSTTKEEDELDLTPSQLTELNFRKTRFIQDGRSLGKPDSEIYNRWNDIQEDIISHVKVAVS